MSGGAQRICAAAWLASLVLACAPERESETHLAASAVAATPRASLVLEPPHLEIGDVAILRVVVSTPPAYRLLPLEPPEVPGLWLLGIEAEEPRQRAERWTHRVNLRVRPRELGRIEWPELALRIERADGEQQTLVLPGRALEVVSIGTDIARGVEPFGLRELESPAPTAPLGHPLVWGGGGFALGLLTALLARRRSRGARATAATSAPPADADDLASWAGRELDAARDALPSDPRRAANAGAEVLRHFVARRFDVDLEAATTEELAAQSPPLRIRSRWPELLRLLREFDALRFRGLAMEEAARSQLTRTLADTRHFVVEAAPGRPSGDARPT